MIPDGWVLVPVKPTERMLTEFSGVWAPWLPKDRRNLELDAYAAMLQVVPTAPTGGDNEVYALRRQIKQLQKQLGISKAETRKAYKKLDYAWEKIRNVGAQKPTSDGTETTL